MSTKNERLGDHSRSADMGKTEKTSPCINNKYISDLWVLPRVVVRIDIYISSTHPFDVLDWVCGLTSVGNSNLLFFFFSLLYPGSTRQGSGIKEERYIRKLLGFLVARYLGSSARKEGYHCFPNLGMHCGRICLGEVKPWNHDILEV